VWRRCGDSGQCGAGAAIVGGLCYRLFQKVVSYFSFSDCNQLCQCDKDWGSRPEPDIILNVGCLRHLYGGR
jgi:hypothetical protein